MRLYAIGDVHLSYKLNAEAIAELEPHLEDGLILCGDVGETAQHLHLAFSIAAACFKYVFWVPGNHELYTLPSPDENGQDRLRGQAKYEECVQIARQYRIRTPEDPYMLWTGEGGPCIIALMFTLYDYSFRPADVARERALEWAAEKDIVATDESLLHNDPYPSRDAWCEALVAATEKRLQKAQGSGAKTVLVNHWPLREDLVWIPRIPRFSLWCGTKATESWHQKYNAKVVVTGHLHVRRTDWIDGVRFEECSLGYPKQWEDARKSGKDINSMLREILPGPEPPEGGVGTVYRRYG